MFSAVMTAHPADVNAGVSTIADSTRKMVARCQAATSIFWLCIILMDGNRRIRGKLVKLRMLVSSLTIENESDRAELREPAEWLGGCVDEWDSMHRKWVSEIVPRFPSYIPLIDLFGSEIARQLDELACKAEDIGETLALAASGEFAQLVSQELDASGFASARRHETV